jgi:uroporphyrinogen decarboxylase
MDWNQIPAAVGEPDFAQLAAVLQGGRPQRATLFEFFMNGPLYARLAGPPEPSWPLHLRDQLVMVRAFQRAGYDYATFRVPGLAFPGGAVTMKATKSINDGAVIRDRQTLLEYAWMEPDRAQYGILDEAAPYVPEGMKLVVHWPGGVLENAITLVGYEQLCLMICDDPDLAGLVFAGIGSRLVRFTELMVEHETVGAVIGNDDWGFKSQTMLSPADMRRFVFPWHQQAVAAAHAHGRPTILHSCGLLREVMDDVVDTMGYDGKHSFEDAIQPIEAAYDEYHGRIALLGGIDLDFICRSPAEAVYRRSRQMLERAADDGAYALGTGNSVPEFVPVEGYFAMLRAAQDARRG